MTTPTTIDYVAVLRDAFATSVTPEPGIGCGRIYVGIVDKTHAAGIKKAAKKLGKIFQTRGHQGASNVLYVGYDNCDGRSLALGTAIVAKLKAAGIASYRDEQGD